MDDNTNNKTQKDIRSNRKSISQNWSEYSSNKHPEKFSDNVSKSFVEKQKTKRNDKITSMRISLNEEELNETKKQLFSQSDRENKNKESLDENRINRSN